jgi:hypothetical protein
MTSNANYNAANPPRSRYFTVRFARAIGRYVFSRRIIWTMAITASLLVLFYQYENWNGTREIATAREHLVARIGTADPMALLPVEVPEAENFFAIPVIKSWRVPNSKAAGGFETVVPDGLPASKELIAQLAEGLDRPSSQLIPCRRRSIADAGGDVLRAKPQSVRGILPFYQELARHLKAAATEGDAATTRNLAGILLKLVEAFATEPVMLGPLVAIPMQGMALPALNAGLNCTALTESDFATIQSWLLRVDDLKQLEKVFQNDVLRSNQGFMEVKQAALNHDLDRWLGKPSLGNVDILFELIRYGPLGWLDTNGAFAIEQFLTLCGDGGPENWRSAEAAALQIRDKRKKASKIGIAGSFRIMNPRRAVACMGLTPDFSSTWSMSAENLAKRRCAILTCALHRHRLLHGSFPASLTDLDASLLPGPQPDPARADAPMNYRLTGKGFLLWSVGMDRVDDGGDAEKDWVWQHDA